MIAERTGNGSGFLEILQISAKYWQIPRLKRTRFTSRLIAAPFGSPEFQREGLSFGVNDPFDVSERPAALRVLRRVESEAESGEGRREMRGASPLRLPQVRAQW